VFLFVGSKTVEKFKQIAMETAVNYVKEAISAEKRNPNLSVTLVNQVCVVFVLFCLFVSFLFL
jgi:hypothetical protein